jgi:hypothetical protein
MTGMPLLAHAASWIGNESIAVTSRARIYTQAGQGEWVVSGMRLFSGAKGRILGAPGAPV